MTKARFTTAISFMALAVTMASSPALAQEAASAAAAPPEAEGDIVVTARFRQERVQDAPLAVTALSGGMLESKNITNLSGAAGFVPNVILQTSGTNSGKSLAASIRGIGQTDFNLALEPGVGVYMDDVYYGTLFGSALELGDIDRLEVYRGPQGTLFGRNSIGGAVRVYSTKPKGDNSGYVELGYGSRNKFIGRAAIDLGLAENLSLRVSGGAVSQDGYVNMIDYACRNKATAGTLPQRATSADCRVGTMGGQDAQFVRAALRYSPDSSLDVNLWISHNRDNGESTPETLVAIPGSGLLTSYNTNYVSPTFGGFAIDARLLANRGFYETYADFRDVGSGLVAPNKATIDETVIGGSIDYDLGSVKLRSVTGYRTFTGSFSLAQGGSPVLVLGIYNPLKADQFTQEATVSGGGKLFADGKFDWTVGGFYYHNVANNGGFVNLASLAGGPGGTPLRFTQDNTARSESYALFAHANINITEALGVELGYRYTHDSKSFKINQFFIDTLGRPTTVRQTPDVVDTPQINNRHDFRVGLSYKITPDIMAYGTVSSGYKPGGSNPRPLAAQDVVAFGPEKVTAYEVGLKTQLFDRAVTWNTAVFQSDYSDLQVNGLAALPGTNPPVFSTRLSNFGKVRIRGIESEIFARPVAGLQLDASLGYIDYAVTDVGAATGLTASSKPNTVPDMTISAGAQYQIGLGSAGSLTPRLDVRYQSSNVSQSLDVVNTFIPERTLLNAQLTWASESGDWSAILSAINLTDKQYYIAKISSAVPFGTVDGMPGAPREVVLTVKRKF